VGFPVEFRRIVSSVGARFNLRAVAHLRRGLAEGIIAATANGARDVMNGARSGAILVLCGVAAFAAPKARVAPEALDFGRVKAGATAEQTLTVYNDGDAPLRVLRAKASCSCTAIAAPDGDSTTIAPGSSARMTVRFDAAGRVGHQSAAIAITTNDPARPAVTVPVAAFVETLTVVRPPDGLVWQYAARGGAIRRTVVIVPGDASKPIELIDIASDRTALTPTATPVTRNGQRMVDVKCALTKDAPLGLLKATVTARVRVAGEEGTVTIPARGTVVGDIVVTPRELYWPQQPVAPGAKIGEIRVQSSGEGAVPDIAAIKTAGPVRAEQTPAAGEDVRAIAIYAAEDAPAGPCSALVVVMTSSMDEPAVRVPVYFETARRVSVQPSEVVLDPAHAVQRIEFRAAAGAMQIAEATADTPALRVTVVTARQEGAATPAIVEIALADPAAAAPGGAMITVRTDVRGEASIAVPILIRP